VVFIAGCGGYDPDEGGVPNEEDFKLGVATQDGTNMIVVVTFYDDFTTGHFIMYLDHDMDDVADIQINASTGGVDVHQQLVGVPGALNHSGPATIAGPSYTFEVPISALDVTAPNTSHYWFAKLAGGGNDSDRMPDTGYEIIEF
jgi:hypothetical protein